jgi:outer membrane cobalamin receptor
LLSFRPVTAISLLLASPALAQNDAQPTTLQGSLPTPTASPANPLPTVVVVGTRILSPGVSPSGTNDYAITSENISDMPAGENTVLTDVLSQMPGVGIDQNQ